MVSWTLNDCLSPGLMKLMLEGNSSPDEPNTKLRLRCCGQGFKLVIIGQQFLYYSEVYVNTRTMLLYRSGGVYWALWNWQVSRAPCGHRLLPPRSPESQSALPIQFQNAKGVYEVALCEALFNVICLVYRTELVLWSYGSDQVIGYFAEWHQRDICMLYWSWGRPKRTYRM